MVAWGLSPPGSFSISRRFSKLSTMVSFLDTRMGLMGTILKDCSSALWLQVLWAPAGFNLLLNLSSIVEWCQRVGLSCHQYTDYTQFYLCKPLDPRGTVNTLNHCLSAVIDWKRNDKLTHNHDKMVVLLVTTGSILGDGLRLLLNGVVHPQKSQVHSLCVLLNPWLLLVEQPYAWLLFNRFTNCCGFLLHCVLATVIDALGTSRFDNCGSKLDGQMSAGNKLLRTLIFHNCIGFRFVSGQSSKCSSGLVP